MANEALYSDKWVSIRPYIWPNPTLKYLILKVTPDLTQTLTDILIRFIKLNLAQALSNNTKFYFSGQQSELGSLFNKILGNG